MLFVSFPAAKDPTFTDRYPGKSVCTVVTFANWDWFKQWQNERVNKRGTDYEAVKMAIAKRMWDQVLQNFPQLADQVEHFEVGSPVTNNYYIASTRGETYGLDHSVRRFGDPDVLMKLRPETEIPGLMLTGQDVLSCGFTAAMFGGMLCASSILHRNLYTDLVKLRKQLSKTE
jgi:all-trans-retinol 13,14-reductase